LGAEKKPKREGFPRRKARGQKQELPHMGYLGQAKRKKELH